nr:putative nadh dehydrogenase [Quercus suber]
MAEVIVIVGSGWAGYTLAHSIDDQKYDVTVISPQPTTAYTPLLASAACGLFNFSLAEEPIRHKNRKIRFVQALVLNVDFETRTCFCQPAFPGMENRKFDIKYDRIVLAPGCTNQTFDTPGVSDHALFVRNVNDAMAIRARLQDVIEMASLPCIDEEEQRALLHFIIVGGGPTGVEITAELNDLIRNDYAALYPELKDKFSVTIHDVAPTILSMFDQKLAEHAMASFSKSGVSIKGLSHITEVKPGVISTREDGEIRFGMLIWAVGNKQVPLVDALPVLKSAHLPRLLTNEFLHLLSQNGQPIESAFGLGDAADIRGAELPTTAEVACQKGEYLANVLNKKTTDSFKYAQKEMVAYVGQHDGVIAGSHNWTGRSAWIAWRVKGLGWSRNWRNKIMMTMNWSLDYLYGKELARANKSSPSSDRVNLPVTQSKDKVFSLRRYGEIQVDQVEAEYKAVCIGIFAADVLFALPSHVRWCTDKLHVAAISRTTSSRYSIVPLCVNHGSEPHRLQLSAHVEAATT